MNVSFRRPHRSVIAGAILVTALALGACTAGSNSNESQNAPVGSDAPAGSGTATGSDTTSDASPAVVGGVVRVGLIQDSQGLDPALTTESQAIIVNSLIYDPLLDFDQEGNLVGRLATEWTTSEDGLTVTLTIREGVTFSDGTPLTAADAAYTLNRIRGMETSPRASLLAPVEDVTAPDDTTVVITLNAPYQPLLSSLTQFWSGIVSEAQIDEFGDLQENPLGTGPFKLADWDKDTLITLERNDSYWRSGEGLPYLDGVEFSFNTNASARIAALESDEVDVLYNVDAELLPTLEQSGNYDLLGKGVGDSWMYLLLNQQWGPLADLNVRQAIYTALDRDELSALCMPDTSTPLAGGILPSNRQGAITEPIFPTDVEAAKALLAKSDHADGFEFQINVLTGWDFQICTAEAIKQQLEPLGVIANINVTDLGTMNEATSTGVEDGTFQAQVIAWGGTPDPDQRLSQVFQTGGGANYVGYSNAEVDELLQQARAETDQAARADLYQQAQTIITETGPYAFLYNYDTVNVATARLDGFRWTISGQADFGTLAEASFAE